MMQTTGLRNARLTAWDNPFATVAWLIVSTATLSWVALFNDAPLVFPDTIAYATAAIRDEVPSLFSAFYGYLILPLHQGRTLWPVVVAQGAVVAHLLLLVTREASARRLTGMATASIIAILAVGSSLPWVSGQILPDVFTPVVLLGYYLMALCSDRLSRGELMYVGALTTIAITTHLSHIPLAVGLLVCCLALQYVTDPRPHFRQRTILLSSPVALAIAAMLTVNVLHSREVGLARNSHVFLLAKWIDEGPAFSYLSESCDRKHYVLCEYMDELAGKSHDELKWGWDSPFRKAGGFDALEPEAREIVWATLRTHPLQIIRRAASDVGRQLTRFRTGDGLTPTYALMVAPHLGKVFGPDVEASVTQSREGRGALPLAAFRGLHMLTVALSMVYCVASVLLRWRWMPGRVKFLFIVVQSGIFLNAIVTAALSGPYDRYLARVIWLTCYLALVDLSIQLVSRRPASARQ
jgi:hypothetical protein